MREFDASFTSKLFGFKNVEDYYAKATLHDKLHNIEVPLLCLSAADDPFQPLEGNYDLNYVSEKEECYCNWFIEGNYFSFSNSLEWS